MLCGGPADAAVGIGGGTLVKSTRLDLQAAIAASARGDAPPRRPRHRRCGPTQGRGQVFCRRLDQPTPVARAALMPDQRGAGALPFATGQHAQRAGLAGAADTAAVARCARGRLGRGLRVKVDDLDVHLPIVAPPRRARSFKQRRRRTADRRVARHGCVPVARHWRLCSREQRARSREICRKPLPKSARDA